MESQAPGWMGGLTIWLWIAALFLLSVRNGIFTLQISDILMFATGILFFINPTQWALLRTHATLLSRYLLYFAVLIGFIVIAQIMGWFLYHIPITPEIFLDYGRLSLNVFVFFLGMLIMIRFPKFLAPATISIIASPLLVLPVYLYAARGGMTLYMSSGRLAGLLSSPITFGAWLSIVFILSLGLFLCAKKRWQRAVIVVWLAVIANFVWLTQTRATWLALPPVIILWAIYYCRQHKKRECILLIAVSIVACCAGYLLLAVVPKTQTFIAPISERALHFVAHPLDEQSRTGAWLSGIPKVFEHALGFGFQGEIKTPGFPISLDIFLEVASIGGLGAVAALIAIFAKTGSYIKKSVTKNSNHLHLAWIASLLAIFCQALLFNFFLVRIFWVVLGMALGVCLSSTRYEASSGIVT